MPSEYLPETATVPLEQIMAHIKAGKEYSFSVYKKIRDTFDSCLGRGVYEPLLELLPYFDDPDSHPDFIYTSDMQKVSVLLNALQLELKSGKTPFLSAAKSFDDLLSQYAVTVFALRRLELSLSPEAMEEAASYLASVPFNIYIAKLLAENEYFENYEKLYLNTYLHLKDYWCTLDRIPWLTWLLEKSASENASMELASLYIQLQSYDKAYAVLQALPAPSLEVLSLIESLKELTKK